LENKKEKNYIITHNLIQSRFGNFHSKIRFSI